MKHLNDNLLIAHSVLKKLPKACSIGPLVLVQDMDNSPRAAMIITWIELHGRAGVLIRRGYFCTETGDYLGDHIPPEEKELGKELIHPLDR